MKKGFTIIEMAIAIVIIGLIMVGIMQGQDLIKVSQLHRIMTSVEDMKRSYVTFRAKYNCIPGDCAKARAFISQSTMDGNGDGEITPILIGSDTLYENFLAFEHMGLAGFYKDYSSKVECYFNADVTNLHVLFDDCNYPKPARSATLFMFEYLSAFNPVRTNLVKSGEPFACANTTAGCLTGNNNTSFSAEDIDQFDVIFDDGMPFKGRVVSACSSTVADFQTYDISHYDDSYDHTRQNCPVIIKF